MARQVRTRDEIEKDGSRKDILTLELLLDIRDLLAKQGREKKPAPVSKRIRKDK